MSEEEKKAMKNLIEIKELVEEDLKYKDYNATAILNQTDLESLVVALNLIEKQQKEIEELKKHKEHEQEYQNGEVFSAKQMYYIEENYIDKDKIREILKDLDEFDTNFYNIDTFKLATKNTLQELLEE